MDASVVRPEQCAWLTELLQAKMKEGGAPVEIKTSLASETFGGERMEAGRSAKESRAARQEAKKRRFGVEGWWASVWFNLPS